MRPEGSQLRLRGAGHPGETRTAGSGTPSALRLGRLGTGLVLAWLALMLAAAFVLAGSQASSREAVIGRARAKTQYAASFASIYARELLARQGSAGEAWLATPHVSGAALSRTASALGLRGAVLLDGHGHAIAGGISLGEAGTVRAAVAFPTPTGRRVLSGTYPVADTALPIILDHVLAMFGSRVDLVDVDGQRLSAARAPGSGAASYFGAGVAGTPWRIEVRIPNRQLYGLLSGTGRWLAWVALGGLAAAGLAIIVLITRLARRRVQRLRSTPNWLAWPRSTRSPVCATGARSRSACTTRSARRADTAPRCRCW